MPGVRREGREGAGVAEQGSVPLRLEAMLQKSIHNLAVQSLNINVFLLQPSTEIGSYDDLLSDGVVTVTLISYSGRIGVEVFTQRPLA